MSVSYIGADVDSKMTELAIERNGRIVDRTRVFTGVASIREVLASIRGRKKMAIEEGPLAHWLWRELRGCVDELVICDPRRNALIAKDGDKDDAIDAGKLAALLRGGFLRQVHHSEDDDRVELKRWVLLYHDRVAQKTRVTNKIYGQCRHYGLRIGPMCLLDPVQRREWFSAECPPTLQAMLRLTLPGLALAADQVSRVHRELCRRCKAYPIIERWRALPGIGPIRSVTFLAFIDTPWRFKTKEKLAKYCGLGIRRYSSGTDRRGRMRNNVLGLEHHSNRLLKDMAMGAVQSAVMQGDNPFARTYRRSLEQGVTPQNAAHTTARKFLAVMWGMWKSGRLYEPESVCAMS
jgi:transposase